MAPQYQVYALPGYDATDLYHLRRLRPRVCRSSLGRAANQNFNLTAWMVGQSDPAHYGQLDVYETPQGTPGPANADAEISANKTVSADISLLDQKGSEVFLGETLMVPIANSMVYLRPLYVASTTNPQPNLQYVVAVLREERADRIVAGVGALRSAPGGRVPPQRKRRLFDRDGSVGGDRVPQRCADRLCQPPTLPSRRRTSPRSSRRFRPWSSRSPRPSRCSARRDRRQGRPPRRRCRTTKEGEVHDEDVDHDDILGADEHRAEGLDPDDGSFTRLDHEHLNRLGNPQALSLSGLRADTG